MPTKNIFVDPHLGSDSGVSNHGWTINKPLKTLAAAQDLIRISRSHNNSMRDSKFVVHLSSGEHLLSNTMQFDARDSFVEFRSSNKTDDIGDDEIQDTTTTTWISGAVSIPSWCWERIDNITYRCFIEHISEEHSINVSSIRTVRVGETLASTARYPNSHHLVQNFSTFNKNITERSKSYLYINSSVCTTPQSQGDIYVISVVGSVGAPEVEPWLDSPSWSGGFIKIWPKVGW
jgi:hypothetical protein